MKSIFFVGDYMAREFTFKEVKQKLKFIAEIKKSLSKASNFQVEKEKKITNVFIALQLDGYFSKMANDELLGKEVIGFNDSFKKLIFLMNQHLNSNELVNHSIELYKKINEDTKNDIESLNSGKNPILWLFASGKKKQAASDAYSRITDYMNSYIIEDSKNTIQKILDLENISNESAVNDYCISK